MKELKACLAIKIILIHCLLTCFFVKAFEHYDGPYFEDSETTFLNVTEGQTVYFDCKVHKIGKKIVTWVRHNDGIIELITYGLDFFHNDRRFSIRFEDPNNWKLRLNAVRKKDSGQYECQISTHPPTKRSIFLVVQDPRLVIRNDVKEVLSKTYIKQGDNLSLECFVEPVSFYSIIEPFWKHNKSKLKIKPTELWTEGVRTDNSMSLWIHFQKVKINDAGIYSCSLKSSKEASINLYVIEDVVSSVSTCLQNLYVVTFSVFISCAHVFFVIR